MRAPKLASLLFAVLFVPHLCVPALAQRPAPQIGDAAPGLRLWKTLQAPAGTAADLAALKGHVVVLEFWATWCAPCVPAIKHFNELADSFRDKPVRFIAVTDEDETQIAQFVKDYPIRGWVGLDKNRETFDAYHAIGIPHTVIINQDGRIAAITEPAQVTAAALADLLAGKQITLPLKGTVSADLEWDKAGAADGAGSLMQVIIKRSNATTGGHDASQPGRFAGDGVPLLAAIIAAYQTSPQRVVSNLPESTEKYRISVIVPPGREATLYPLFQQALAATFGIGARREVRETDVLVLSVPRGQSANLRPSQSAEELRMVLRGQIRARKQPVKTLAEQLEMILGLPVVEETGLAGEYDWELPYNHADRNVLVRAVRERLGLELTPTRQPIEILVVDKPAAVR